MQFHIMLEYFDSLIHILRKFSPPVHYGHKDLHSAKSEADISCLSNLSKSCILLALQQDHPQPLAEILNTVKFAVYEE